MSFSLYDVSVGTYLQQLGAVAGILDKGAAWSAENNVDLTDIVDTRIHPDMFPFAFQVRSVCHHSWGAIQGAKAGVFGPPAPPPEGGYPALQALVAEALDGMKTQTRDEIDELVGRDVTFQLNEKFALPFTAENFLMSFSLPNFYFHCTTTYAILRQRGVKLGKRDFMGAMRMKQG